ncbi:hypothetical protein [Pedobacter duraquae]|uniref:hypothetical protein n=1 Tax=Pedobacter duraquae TaxID=425511 RepID=UPI0014150F78|nr:hypothetical protein [Pedobacter duraquae]
MKYTDTGAYLYKYYDLYQPGDTVLKDYGLLYLTVRQHHRILLISIGDGDAQLQRITW